MGFNRSKSPPFFVKLDSSISIPVFLVDISPPNTSPFAVGSKGPNIPGKFYKLEPSLSLLDTMRTGGPSAQVVVLENVADEIKQHFERFAARLEVGDVVCLHKFLWQNGFNFLSSVRSPGGCTTSSILLFQQQSSLPKTQYPT